MENLISEVIESRKNKIIYLLTLFFGIVVIVSSVFPYLKYEFNGYIYKISCVNFLLSNGIVINDSILSIPIIIKISLFIGLFSVVLAIIFLLLKKYIFSGISFIASSLSSLVMILSSSNIHNSLLNININQVKIQYLLPCILTLLLGLTCSIISISLNGIEKLAEIIFLVFSCISIGSVIIITVYMLISGIPAVLDIGLLKFLFRTSWNPSNNEYGIFSMILSSIVGTLGAIVIGVPIGLFTAVFLSEIASKRVANLIRPSIQLLAGIPSVVYGFFGMLIIVPTIRNLFPNSLGDSLLAVIIILSIMVLPTIISTSETSLRAVPIFYREASLALGTTPIKTIFKVTIPAAKSGILSGVILGVGRAIGETMAVIMVAGNVVNMPSLLGTVRLLTTGIVLEMSYSSGLHRQALFAIGLILFIFIMIVNISFAAISKKGVNLDEK